MRRFAVLGCFLFLLATQYAEATETKALNFPCEGKLKGTITGEKAEAIHNVGLVVDLVEKTVSFNGHVARINKVDAAQVSFGSEEINTQLKGRVSGYIDRVTGVVEATTISTGSTLNWDMLCKPTSGLFWGTAKADSAAVWRALQG